MQRLHLSSLCLQKLCRNCAVLEVHQPLVAQTPLKTEVLLTQTTLQGSSTFLLLPVVL